MTTLLLVRHGETDAVGKLLAGWAPGWHLNDHGRNQARQLANSLAAITLDAVYTSPLERTVETASILSAPHGLEPIPADDLGECRFGGWEGRTFEQLQRDPSWLEFNSMKSMVRPPEGELMIEVQVRMVRLVTKLLHVHADKRIAIVSHADCIRLLLAHCLGLPLDMLPRFEISPGSVSHVRFAGHVPTVTGMNINRSIVGMNSAAQIAPETIRQRISELGQWFHNINLQGVQTAPNHFLGDYPSCKWVHFKNSIPADLTGKTVLDIGCNGGFYSIAMKLRGADRVVSIDTDPVYLEQARFAAEMSGVDLVLKQMDVYNVAQLGEKFDIVLFMGVLYHLRHPLLALDLLNEHVVNETLVFQSLVRGSKHVPSIAENYAFEEIKHFRKAGYPQMYFVEHRYSNDPTNWWIPNRACVEAMLRSAGFDILNRPEDEVYICKRSRRHG